MAAQLRPAELAGRWYPASPEACDAALVPEAVDATHLPKAAVAAIAPHAGWAYSGRIAYTALSMLAKARPDADLAILYGGHLTERDRPRILIEGAFETPYGPVAVATDLAQAVSMVVDSEPETPEEYYDDNAVEVLVPMVKKLWPDTPMLTVGVPPIPDATKIGAEVVDQARAAGFARPILIGSTDLTHYGPNYDFHPAGRGFPGLKWVKESNDAAFVERLAAMDAHRLVWTARQSRNACCPGAAAAALAAAKKLGATRAAVTRYTTSYDEHPTESEPQSFVGYVGLIVGR